MPWRNNGDCGFWSRQPSSFGSSSRPPKKKTRKRTVAADISLAVIHKRAKRPGTARRSELVNNCAAGENFAGERPAPARSQSQSPHPKRVIGRLLAEPEALAPTSHRKTPPEGRYISKMDGSDTRRKNQPQQQQTMNDSQQWQQHRAVGALDWASEKHSVVLVNQTGKVIEHLHRSPPHTTALQPSDHL